MNSVDLEKINNIIIDILLEFQNEQNRIQVMYDNGTSRLAELEEDIITYKDSEDVDFKVFSPRNVSNLSEEKLMAMDSEKRSIEESNKDLYKQLKYYTDKVQKLRTVLSLLDSSEIDNTEYTSVEDEVPSRALYEKDPIDDEVAKIRKLFSQDDKESDVVVNNLKDVFDSENSDEDNSEDKDTEIINSEEKLSESNDKNVNSKSYSEISSLNDFECKSLVDDLDRISHRIEISYKVIDNDTFRTKMDLKSIKNNLDDIIRGIKD